MFSNFFSHLGRFLLRGIDSKFYFIKQQQFFKFVSYLEIYFTLVFPTIFPIHYCIVKWGLGKLSLKYSNLYMFRWPLCCLICLVVKQKGNPVPQLHALKVGGISTAGCIHHQVCMNTVHYVKTFSFFSSCLTPTDPGVMGVDRMLNGCTGLGNPESHVTCANWSLIISGPVMAWSPAPFFLVFLNSSVLKVY